MNIPGYYYDPVKRRYFKVENSKTAPTNAAWSSNSVKRQKLRDEDVAAALRHKNVAKTRIRRARVLHEPLTGGFFAREYGAAKDDMQAACFVEGMRHKGCFPLLGPVKCMFIGGYDDKTRMCNVYVAANMATDVNPHANILLSTYIPRDKNGRLNERLLANYRIPQFSTPEILPYIPHISDIQYHAPSNSIFVTSTQPLCNGSPNSLWTLSPTIDDGNNDPLRPRWIIPSGPLRNLAPSRLQSSQNDYGAHCVAPAPAFSSAACAVGTSRGIIQWDRDLTRSSTWLPSAARFVTNPERHFPGELFHDVFAVDFHPSNGDILRFGGRPGALFTADTRVPLTTWSYLKLPSTITHLKCLNGGNQVLVAGLQNQLGVYDLRFTRSHQAARDDSGDSSIDIDSREGDINSRDWDRAHNSRRRDLKGRNHHDRRGHRNDKTPEKRRPDPANKPITQPVIRFEKYRNNAHIDIGFSYDAATGVVAAAHDDVPGTVALYSVRTGARLRVLDVATEERGISSRDETSNVRSLGGLDHPVIKSLQFQAFPGDLTPTLFVGYGPRSNITAFTFGVDDVGDEA
ncbi:hypothetical protein F5Y12DRAFT_30035 [Xylaria sp. FL1777]|nr:hypothetical protein F5Y12DRAFT_30035 [Xylaria sp. FL1777]